MCRLRIKTLILMSCIVGIAIAATVVKPKGFESRSSQSYEDEEDYDAQAQTHAGYRSRLYDYSSEEDQQQQPQQEEPKISYHQTRNSKQNSNKKPIQKYSEEELEEEEPDRLAILLEKSKFVCQGKTTGYYADDTIGCEVFHYCQDAQRHSWVCPEGFTFHQVHLICMPPSSENICEQSAKYHIVNDYLYKPINLAEHQSKPNITLRYSERYYPESFYDDERQQHYEDRDNSGDRVHHAQRQPVQVGFNSQSVQPQQRKVQQQQHQQQQHQQHQQQQHQQHQHYQHQQAVQASPTPTAYRFATTQPIQQQVYRSPEEINISLQQRRPQVYVPTSTPRYYEDEYIYQRR